MASKKDELFPNGNATPEAAKKFTAKGMRDAALNVAPSKRDDILSECDRLKMSSDMQDFKAVARNLSRIVAPSARSLGFSNYSDVVQVVAGITPLFGALAGMRIANVGYTSPFADLWHTGREFGQDWQELYEGETQHFPTQSVANSHFYQDFDTNRVYKIHRWTIEETFAKTLKRQDWHRATTDFAQMADVTNGFVNRIFVDIERFKNQTILNMVGDAIADGGIFGEAVPVATTTDLQNLAIAIDMQIQNMFFDVNNYNEYNARTGSDIVCSKGTGALNTEDARLGQYGDVIVHIRPDLKSRMNYELISGMFNIPRAWMETNWRTLPPNLMDLTVTDFSDAKFNAQPAVMITHRAFWENNQHQMGFGSETANTWDIPHNWKTQYFVGVHLAPSYAGFEQCYIFGDAAKPLFPTSPPPAE